MSKDLPLTPSGGSLESERVPSSASYLKHERVVFQGNVYWWHEDLLCPLHHFDDAGELLVDGVSFAVIEGESIFRYGKKIGVLADLRPIVDVVKSPEGVKP